MENKSRSTNDGPRKLPLKLLEEITNSFAKEQRLGSGAFGDVYKGVLDGEVIAVKQLRFMPGIIDKQFENEFDHLSKLKHQNIVQLVGFCDETKDVLVPHGGQIVSAVEIHRALCLEFVPRCLSKFLSEKYLVHDWHVRFKIIKGICEGLNYLDGYSVMHLDLKPDNILLDEKMVPKIADFGLSRLMGEENTIITMSRLGTLGYMPPEFINNQIISTKYDIFSLGVILKKIVSGEMDYFSIADMGNRECIEHVHNYWEKKLQETPCYASLEVDCKQVRSCIEIAVACTEPDRQKRPTIEDIVRKLNKLEASENDSRSRIEQFQDGQCILPKRDILKRPSPEMEGEDSRISARELPFEFLRYITDDFATERKVGRGGFGTVYKGIIRSEDVNQLIAVKKLGLSSFRSIYNDDKDRRREVSVLNQSSRRRIPDGVRNPKRGSILKSIITGWTSPTDWASPMDWASPTTAPLRLCGKVRNKLSFLVEIEHENIASLVGFSSNTMRKIMDVDGRYISTVLEESFLCYEYFPNGSLDKYIYGEYCPLDWQTRFKIIKGICQGLHFLHEELNRPIVHLNISPRSILLDGNMVPKISDVGLSIFFEEQKLFKMRPAIGYTAPEYSRSEEPSTYADIYSLGVLIIEIVTGEKNSPDDRDMGGRKFIKHVRQNWVDTYTAPRYAALDANFIDQFQICIEAGLQCVEESWRKRPSIVEIVDRLNNASSGSMLSKLGMQRRRLRFPFEPKRLTSCALYLPNSSNDRMAFRLLTKTQRRYLTKLPLCGIVPPQCSYTLTVIMREQKQQPPEEFLTLQSIIVPHQQNADPDSLDAVFFKEDKETIRDEVKEVTLAVVCDPLEEAFYDQSIQSEIIACQNYREVLSVDVHPTEPWILTSNRRGIVSIWDYQTRATVNSFEVNTEEPVYSAKFVARQRWLVAGDGDGYIRVYSYDTMEEVQFFQAHAGHQIMSLAVNPTHSFVLSASDDHLIKLWDWKKGWECMRAFKGHCNRVTQVMFDPEDSSSFASASFDRTVKIWNIYSATPKTTLDGHLDGLLCLDYFTDDKWQFLISGSSDGAAKIWDLETKTCVGMLEGHANRLNALCWHPEFPVLITGSLDGTIQTWGPTSNTFRLTNITGIKLGAVNAFRYIKELRRLVVGCDQGIAMMGINFLQDLVAAQMRTIEDELDIICP